MKKNNIIISIIFFIFFILSISTYYSATKQQEYIALKQKQSFDTMQQIIDGKMIFFRRQFANRIKSIIYRFDKFEITIKQNDKQKIAKMMNRLLKILKKENKYSKSLHLISNNNISIYRAHKPDKFGDDLTGVRPIVDFVNKYKRAKYGFEAGLYTVAYRIDIPIIYDGKYYGVLEYGIDPKLFLDDLTSVSDYIESAILINKEKYNNLKKYNLELTENIVSSSKKYILMDDDTFFKDLDLDHIHDDLRFNKDKDHYASYLYTLLSFDNKSIGKILIAINTTADEHRYEEIIKLSIINQIILIVIIFVIVYYAFSYYEREIKIFVEHEKQNEMMLHQQSKMASMGEMIGNIAHQWRQPLSSISTIASGINAQKEYEIFDESSLMPSMDKIVEQTQYMSKTIDDFRNFFKNDKEKILFSLDDAIEQNISLVETSLKNNNINFITNLDHKIELYGYKNELTQAFINIINNAKDQLVKSDNIDNKIIKIETMILNNMIHIKIIDNGGGVPDDIIGKVFEPYFTTKHQSQGTGIGLFMTHEIIVKHFNGTLEVTNVEFEYLNKKYTGAQFDIALAIE